MLAYVPCPALSTEDEDYPMPTHINIQINDHQQEPQQRKLPPATASISRYHASPIQEDVAEPPQDVAVHNLPPRPVDCNTIKDALAGVLMFTGLVLFVSLLLGIFQQPTHKKEPTLTQSQVEALLQQERLQWETEYREAELRRLQIEHEAFKEGVVYGR